MQNSSPRITTDGLILCLDMDNVKSYAGPAITNLAQTISPVSFSGTGYSFVGSSSYEKVPQLGLRTVYHNDAQNNYPAVSDQCCPQIFNFRTTYMTVTGNTLYTCAIVYRSDTGYTSPNFMYRLEYNTDAYVTEGGEFSTSDRIYLGDGWYWAWGSFTTNASTNRLYMDMYFYQYSTIASRVSVAHMLITQGDFTALHPKHWPNVNSAIGNQLAWKDISSAKTFTFPNLDNAVYTSSGGIDYNGSSSYVRIPDGADEVLNTQNVSVEVWFKTNNTTQNGFIFERGEVNTQYSLFQAGIYLVWRQILDGVLQEIAIETSFYITAGVWAHVVAAYTSGRREIYVNTFRPAVDAMTGLFTPHSTGASIGVYGGYAGSRGYYFDGEIAVVRVYNKTLTETEVIRNYNASKSRFGL